MSSSNDTSASTLEGPAPRFGLGPHLESSLRASAARDGGPRKYGLDRLWVQRQLGKRSRGALENAEEEEEEDGPQQKRRCSRAEKENEAPTDGSQGRLPQEEVEVGEAEADADADLSGEKGADRGGAIDEGGASEEREQWGRKVAEEASVEAEQRGVRDDGQDGKLSDDISGSDGDLAEQEQQGGGTGQPSIKGGRTAAKRARGSFRFGAEAAVFAAEREKGKENASRNESRERRVDAPGCNKEDAERASKRAHHQAAEDKPAGKAVSGPRTRSNSRNTPAGDAEPGAQDDRSEGEDAPFQPPSLDMASGLGSLKSDESMGMARESRAHSTRSSRSAPVYKEDTDEDEPYIENNEDAFSGGEESGDVVASAKRKAPKRRKTAATSNVSNPATEQDEDTFVCPREEKAMAGGVVDHSDSLMRSILDDASNHLAEMPAFSDGTETVMLLRNTDFRSGTSAELTNTIRIAKSHFLSECATLESSGLFQDVHSLNNEDVRIITGASSLFGVEILLYDRKENKASAVWGGPDDAKGEPIILHKFVENGQTCYDLRWGAKRRYFDAEAFFWSLSENPAGWKVSPERRQFVQHILRNDGNPFEPDDHVLGIPGDLPKHILESASVVDILAGRLPPVYIDTARAVRFIDANSIPVQSFVEIHQSTSTGSHQVDGDEYGVYLIVLCEEWGEVKAKIEQALATDGLGPSVCNFLERLLRENQNLAGNDDYSLVYNGMCHSQPLSVRLDAKGRDGFEARVLDALGGATMRILLCNTECKRQSDTMEAFSAAVLELASRENVPGFRLLKRDCKSLNIVNCGIARFLRATHLDIGTIVSHVIMKPESVGEEPVMRSKYSIPAARLYLATFSDAVLDHAQAYDEFLHITRVEDVTYDLLHSFVGRRGYEAQVYAFMEETGIESFEEAASMMMRKVSLAKFYNVGDLDSLTQQVSHTLATATDERGKIQALESLLENWSMEPVEMTIVSKHNSAYSEAGEELRFELNQVYGAQAGFCVVVSDSNAKKRMMSEARALLGALPKDNLFKPTDSEKKTGVAQSQGTNGGVTIGYIRGVMMHLLNRGEVVLANLEYELKTALENANATEEIASITGEEEKVEAKCNVLKQVMRALSTELQNVAVTTKTNPPYDTKFSSSNSFVDEKSVIVSVNPVGAKEQMLTEVQALLKAFAHDSDINRYLDSRSSQSAKAKAVRDLLDGVLRARIGSGTQQHDVPEAGMRAAVEYEEGVFEGEITEVRFDATTEVHQILVEWDNGDPAVWFDYPDPDDAIELLGE